MNPSQPRTLSSARLRTSTTSGTGNEPKPLNPLAGSIIRGAEALGKFTLRSSVTHIPDDDRESKINPTMLTDALSKLVKLNVQSPETLELVNKEIEESLKRHNIHLDMLEIEETTLLQEPGKIGQHSQAPLPTGKTSETRIMDETVATLPDPQLLPLYENIKSRLVYETLVFDLGYIDPEHLLKCGTRILQTQVREMEFSPLFQYMVRVLSVYYSNIPSHGNTMGFFSIAHYCHSVSTGKGMEHATQPEGIRIAILEYGIYEIVVKLAQALIPPSVLTNPRNGFNLSSEYCSILLGEIRSRYPDLMVIVKMVGYIAANETTFLDPYLDNICYSSDYDSYLFECCEGGGVLDSAPVKITPKVYVPPVPRPSVSTGPLRVVRQEPQVQEQDKKTIERPRPSAVLHKPKYFHQVSVQDDKGKSKVDSDMDAPVKTVMFKETMAARKTPDDLMHLMKWMSEAEEILTKMDKKIDGIVDFNMKLGQRVSNLEAGVGSPISYGSFRGSSVKVDPGSVKAMQSVEKIDLDLGNTDEGDGKVSDYRLERDQLLKDLRNYDKIKDKDELVKVILRVFQKAGKSELGSNITVKALDRSMTRNRIIQSLSIL